LFPELGWRAAMITGLTCMATAVSLTMSALKSEGYSKSKAAMGIMTSAVLDDVM
jgi:Kef-type K+ transport system membrane component KefB